MNILTFDIEEWYTYCSRSTEIDIKNSNRLEGYFDKLLEVLDQKKYTISFFVLGAIARSNPHVLHKIANAGHQIGCHSDTHQWLTNFSRAELFEDTNRAISSIEEIIGKKVVCYRAPAFSITEKNKWAFEVLHQFGIEYDCSIFPASR
ncbi:MAG: polysaccharide deacetylase family protein, partial [Bacteroidales bacterium]|nr:polysaccharide deacetylase family protein [Bacteroidales bacterium]